MKTKKVKFLKGEIFMYYFLAFLLMLNLVATIFTNSLVSSSSIEVEILEKNIDKQKGKNESISMQVYELASLSNIQTVADEYGLSYNNSNIKVIEGD